MLLDDWCQFLEGKNGIHGAHDKLLGLPRGHLEGHAIELQKNNHCGKSGSLVGILKRMIHGEGMKKGGSFIEEGRIGVLGKRGGLGAKHGGFQKTEIVNPGRFFRAVSFNHGRMDRDHFTDGR